MQAEKESADLRAGQIDILIKGKKRMSSIT